MTIIVTSPPAVEPITTAEAKEWLRIDTSDTSQDAILAIQITSCVQTVENYTRRKLITQTLSYDFPSHGRGRRIELPFGNAQSIFSLTVYDEDSSGAETSTVVNTSNYQLIGGTYVQSRSDGWTLNRTDKAGTLVYIAGYGAAGSSVPGDIRHAILELLALRFERRGDEDRDQRQSREREILHSISNYVMTPF